MSSQSTGFVSGCNSSRLHMVMYSTKVALSQRVMLPVTAINLLLLNQQTATGFCFSDLPIAVVSERSQDRQQRYRYPRLEFTVDIFQFEQSYRGRHVLLPWQAAKLDPTPDSIDIDDGNDGQETIERDPPAKPPVPSFPPLPAVMFATISFVSFWPLLALMRSTSSPIDGFDIDAFMALRGILDDNDAVSGIRPEVILELPSLGPAERLVDAIFGPP